MLYVIRIIMIINFLRDHLYLYFWPPATICSLTPMIIKSLGRKFWTLFKLIAVRGVSNWLLDPLMYNMYRTHNACIHHRSINSQCTRYSYLRCIHHDLDALVHRNHVQWCIHNQNVSAFDDLFTCTHGAEGGGWRWGHSLHSHASHAPWGWGGCGLGDRGEGGGYTHTRSIVIVTSPPRGLTNKRDKHTGASWCLTHSQQQQINLSLLESLLFNISINPILTSILTFGPRLGPGPDSNW